MAKIFKRNTINEVIPPTASLNQIEEEAVLNLLTTEEQEKQIYTTGYEDGFAAGLQQGKQLVTQQTEHLQQQLKKLLQTIPQALNEGRYQLKNEIAEIVLAIVQQFFVQQQHNQQVITQQINTILNQLNDKQIIIITLHPSDFNLIQQSSCKMNLNAYKNLSFVTDERLALGGCIIKTEHGLFDSSIERQIDRLKQVLLQIKQSTAHD